MELYQLKGFVTVAQTGSFTRAAEKLYLTQPALSLQIKALEESLQEKLFERHGRSIHLTAAGRVLLERAQQILALVEQSKQEVLAVNGLRGGRLALATNDSYALYLLPHTIQQFRQQFPAVELQISTQSSAAVRKRVLNGAADVGILTLPMAEPHLQADTLFWREDVAICSPDHPLATQRRTSLAELVQSPLLVLETGSSSRRLLEQAFGQYSIVPEMVMELGSLEVIKRLVEINQGVAVVPGFTAEDAVRDGRLHALRLEELSPRAIGLIWRRGGFLSPASQAFISMLRNRTPNMLLWSL